MGQKAIVFYCKQCGELFFAAMARPDVLQANAEEIAEYLQNGDRMEVIDADEVAIQFGTCHCYDEAPVTEPQQARLTF